VPFFGDIPVLGALFRSKRFQNKETELVVFVTPRAVDKNSAEQEQNMGRVMERLDKAPRVGTPDLAAVPLGGGSVSTGIGSDALPSLR
jgi:pilus assembly protein CpaC